MMWLLPRLINHNKILRNDVFFRIMDYFRKPRLPWKAARDNNAYACPEPLTYITRLAMPRDYENILGFLCCTYFKEEPSIVNIGLSNEPPSKAMLHMTMEQIRDGMTIIAVNPDDRIIGAVVNIGACPWDPRKVVQYARCCETEGPPRDLIEFYAYVSRKPDVWNRYCVLKVFECSIVAVDPEYHGIGVARKLIEESWYLARDCSYRLFRIDCTSRYTAKIAQSFGWKKVCTIPYCRYVKDGEMVFKCIQPPHTEVEVYVDRVKFCEAYTLPYKSQKCK